MSILLFLKGMLMGVCDLIPGISGGTIAFITGIYERLIAAVKSFSPQLVKDIFSYLGKRDKKSSSALKQSVKRLDLVFLVTLLAGIGTSLFLGAHLISILLEDYYVFTISFFIGLILASSKIIFDHIENHKPATISFGIMGLLFGLLLAVLIPATVEPSLFYIFISGFLAISAMFLPGISGAFILLILGAYEFMLGVLKDIPNNVPYFLSFALGAALGAFTISRIISYFFSKDKSKTLYVLLGLVIGALGIPLRNIIALAQWDILMVIFFALGFGVVFGADKLIK
ncbi:DUF368 domain-containing protein [Candidatus Woesearchaeota archaeon]|nr:DUF368 domain-containing protein [Candidatus Woesearchaeota archaeon]